MQVKTPSIDPAAYARLVIAETASNGVPDYKAALRRFADEIGPIPNRRLKSYKYLSMARHIVCIEEINANSKQYSLKQRRQKKRDKALRRIFRVLKRLTLDFSDISELINHINPKVDNYEALDIVERLTEKLADAGHDMTRVDELLEFENMKEESFRDYKAWQRKWGKLPKWQAGDTLPPNPSAPI